MRTWESLLLLADLLAFLVLSIRQVYGRRWMHGSPVVAWVALVALVMAAAQWLAEGPRWQMLPAYALTLLFLPAWLAQNAAPMGGPDGRKRPHPTAALVITLGALGLAISGAVEGFDASEASFRRHQLLSELAALP